MSSKSTVATYCFIIITLTFFLSPFFVLLVASFQPITFSWTFSNLTLKHWTGILNPHAGYALMPPLVSSAVVTSTATAACIGISCFAAFSLTKFKFSKRRDVAFFFLSLSMTPSIVPVIPLFFIAQYTGLYDTYQYLILIYTYSNIPFSTWLLRGFFREVPKEIEEASMIDGCTKLGSFFKVTLPLAKTGIAVTTIFTFIFTWNEFTMAALLTDRMATLPVAVGKSIGRFIIHWGTLAAMGTVAIIPVLVLSFIVQKYIITGLTMGAVKG